MRRTGASTCATGTSTTASSPCTRYATSPSCCICLQVPSGTDSALRQVYGPHASVLYARTLALTHSLSSLAHHFLAVDTRPYKLEPGGPGYELVYGCTAVPPYLKALTPAGTLEAAIDAVAAHEQTLLKPLLAYLRSKAARGVLIVGDEFEGPSRVPTVSFVVVGERPIRSKDVVKAFDERGNVRYGSLQFFFPGADHLVGRYSVWPLLCVYADRRAATEARCRRCRGTDLVRALQHCHGG